MQWGSASRTLSASGVRITKFGYLERGLLSALLPNCQPIKHLHFKYISCLGQAAAPDQNYHLHFFTAEVTGSRAERMQVQCNIVRTLHSANITSSFLLQVAGARGGCGYCTVTCRHHHNNSAECSLLTILMVHCACILSALCGHVDTTDSLITW